MHKHMLRLKQTTPYWYMFECETCGTLIECDKHIYWRRRFSWEYWLKQWEDAYHAKNPKGLVITPMDEKQIRGIRRLIAQLKRG